MSEETTTIIEAGVYEDLSSSDYHGNKNTYSSSQLKDILEDPEYFHKKYILGQIERLSIPAFDVGTYFHTAILEPEKLNLECAVYKGIRRGSAWDKFQEDNKGKAIITESEFGQADALIKAVQNSPIAMNRLKRGRPEVSAFVELLVADGQIYSPLRGKSISRGGWIKSKVPKRGTKLMIKVRADLLGDNFILDLKSTSGNTKSASYIKTKISNYSYDLSASLYLDMFSIALDRLMTDFIWTFASKDYYNCKNYMASNDNILVGRQKWIKAIVALAECIESDWQFEDSMAILEPSYFELEHIKPSAGDLL